MEVAVVGLLVSLGGFLSFAEEEGVYTADLLDRLEALAVNVGHRYGMTLIKTADGDILLVGQNQGLAIGAAFGFTEEFEDSIPEQGDLLPVHLVVNPDETVIDLGDGQTVEVAASVTAAAYPGETRPALR
jgi:hypothetical protein